jgi:hypothetical protein
MKKPFLLFPALFLLIASASTEIRSIDISIFGMD